MVEKLIEARLYGPAASFICDLLDVSVSKKENHVALGADYEKRSREIGFAVLHKYPRNEEMELEKPKREDK
jgi:hypothetical protein